ncbi:ABC-type amino acid transport/signal transduction system protein [Candidatus Terasakiella magnetica]|nr:ABC-type amino acid transport/signal transduction system protein [Candidatus Terasakiella magnetica]
MVRSQKCWRRSCGVMLALGLAAMIVPFATLAQPFPEIEYVYPDQSVWTTRTDARGEPENPLLRFAASLFSKAEIPWHGHAYPAARMFEYLQNGTAQFSILVNAPSLQACCLVGRKPVATAEVRVYRKAGKARISTKDDLVGKSVIAIMGYSYAGVLNFINDPKNKISVSSAQTHDSAFMMLDRERADYLLEYSGPAVEVLAAHPVAGIEYDVLARSDVHLILARSYPNAEAVMAKLEAIAATLHVDGIPK